ncbi:MAG: DUF4402 domain-containing protein [bacterium]
MKKLMVLTGLAFLLVSNVHAIDASFSAEKAFNLTLKLFKPITITKLQDLAFPDTTLTGAAYDVSVATADSGAATFNVQGGKNRAIATSIVEPNITMSAPGVTGTLTVDSWAIAAPAHFDASGDANGIKVGAVAHILAASEDGNYAGTATLRVAYQ